MNRYFLGAILLSDSVLDVVRRELRRLSPNVKIDGEEIRSVLLQEVLKREVLEGERAVLARKQASRASSRPLRAAARKEEPPTASIPLTAAVEEAAPPQQSSAG